MAAEGQRRSLTPPSTAHAAHSHELPTMRMATSAANIAPTPTASDAATETALIVHLVMPNGHPGDEFLSNVIEQVEHKFHIGHVTIQIETGTSAIPCVLAPDHVV